MLFFVLDVGRVLLGYIKNCFGIVMLECRLECCLVYFVGIVDGCDGALYVIVR